MSMLNSFSNSITNSTMSRLSAPRSSIKLASLVNLSRSTPSSFSMMSLTLSVLSDIPCLWGWVREPEQSKRKRLQSLHDQPAIDHQNLTGDVGCLLRSQKCHGVCDILRGAEALEGDLSGHRLLRLGCHRPRHIRFDETRRDHVGEDVSRSELFRDRLGKPDQTGLARRIVGLALVADQADDRGNVDDPPPTPLHHAARRRTDGRESATEIGVDDRVPVVVLQPEQDVVPR